MFDAIVTPARRAQIANIVINKLGVKRALEGTTPNTPPTPNKVGYIGVDFDGGKYRARIRFSDALNGRDTRVTLGRFDNAEDAGYAYACAHVRLWGSLSYFVGEVDAADLNG